MMNKFSVKFSGIILPLFLLYLHVPAQSIDKFELCASVEDREPQDIRNVFREGESAWAWMHLTGGTVGDSITVEWYAGEEMVHAHQLAIKYTSMRTYASKTLFKSGPWKVVIKNKEDETLEATSFQVGETEE